MSAPRTDPVIRQLELAQEAARAMWRTYELHFTSIKRDAEWQAQSKELFARCQAADNMVQQVKELRARLIDSGDAGKQTKLPGLEDGA